jgi:putative membrane protein
MMWYGWDSGGWGAWLPMTLMMLVVWGGLIALVVWAVRGTGRPSEPRNDAESILEERFARGEIDADELASRRKALHAGGGKRAA